MAVMIPNKGTSKGQCNLCVSVSRNIAINGVCCSLFNCLVCQQDSMSVACQWRCTHIRGHWLSHHRQWRKQLCNTTTPQLCSNRWGKTMRRSWLATLLLPTAVNCCCHLLNTIFSTSKQQNHLFNSHSLSHLTCLVWGGTWEGKWIAFFILQDRSCILLTWKDLHQSSSSIFKGCLLFRCHGREFLSTKAEREVSNWSFIIFLALPPMVIASFIDSSSRVLCFTSSQIRLFGFPVHPRTTDIS